MLINVDILIMLPFITDHQLNYTDNWPRVIYGGNGSNHQSFLIINILSGTAVFGHYRHIMRPGG